MRSYLESILARLAEQFDPEVMGATLGRLTADVVTALLVFGAFYALWRLVDQVLGPTLRRSRLDLTAAAFVRTTVKYATLVVGAVAAAGQMGLQTASLVTSLGVAGLTLGFAAREALSNVIAGLFIYWDRPFVLDDLIEVGGRYGRVDRITIRSTRVVTPDGRMLAIPNSDMVDSPVASYTNFPHLRLDLAVQVGVEEDLSSIRELLLNLVADDPEIMDEPSPTVVLTELGDYNNTIELQAWIHDERTHAEKRVELRERLFDLLVEAGVDMPFETIELRPIEVERVPQLVVGES
jgi:small conductance mechanosensitive channel